MAFTFSHPAVFIPFKKSRFLQKLSLTGLVAGSIAPDYEYFIQVGVATRYGHTLWGMFLLSWPLAILLALTYQLCIRRILLLHLPGGVQQKLQPLVVQDWRIYLGRHGTVLVFSCLIGVLSHVAWDSFTHHTGFAVSHIPFLQKSVGTPPDKPFPVYHLLQHLSSLVGFVCIAKLYWELPPSPLEYQVSKFYPYYWLLVTVSIIGFYVVKITSGMDYTDIIMLSVTGIAGASYGVLLASFAYYIYARQQS